MCQSAPSAAKGSANVSSAEGAPRQLLGGSPQAKTLLGSSHNAWFHVSCLAAEPSQNICPHAPCRPPLCKIWNRSETRSFSKATTRNRKKVSETGLRAFLSPSLIPNHRSPIRCLLDKLLNIWELKDEGGFHLMTLLSKIKMITPCETETEIKPGDEHSPPGPGMNFVDLCWTIKLQIVELAELTEGGTDGRKIPKD